MICISTSAFLKITGNWSLQILSLNIQTCKNYWELVTVNFELKFSMNFLDIWKKLNKKEPIDLDKIKKY